MGFFFCSLVSIFPSDFFSSGYAVESEFKLGDHFAQNRFAPDTTVLEIQLRWDDLFFLFQPCDSVIFYEQEEESYAT